MGKMVGVDVGGTLLRAARFDDDMSMLERVERESLAEEGSDAVIDRLIELIQQVLPEDPDELAGVGVAVPGPLDTVNGIVLKTPNLPWRHVPLAQILSDALGCTVRLGNDADTAGLAEHRLGAGKGTTHMIYLTISTGIGGGLIDSGRLITGAGLGGEVGHIMVDPNGPQCGCGQFGHLEALGSGTAIANIARQRLAAGVQSSLLDSVNGNLKKISAKTVGEAALAGDAFSIELVREAGRYIGIGIASLMHLFNPERFVLGGGVTRIGDLLLDAIRQSAKDHVMHPRYAENTPIVSAELGKDVGLMGAAILVEAHEHN